MGWRVRPTPGAVGTALLLVGQVSTRRRSARSRPARMTRLKGITAHRAPHSACPSRAGFGKLASWKNECLRDQRGFRALPKLQNIRSEEHTSELQSRGHLVCRLLLEK